MALRQAELGAAVVENRPEAGSSEQIFHQPMLGRRLGWDSGKSRQGLGALRPPGGRVTGRLVRRPFALMAEHIKKQGDLAAALSITGGSGDRI